MNDELRMTNYELRITNDEILGFRLDYNGATYTIYQ
jgi:hypothetical protein